MKGDRRPHEAESERQGDGSREHRRVAAQHLLDQPGAAGQAQWLGEVVVGTEHERDDEQELGMGQ